jgi:hypothetical protein
MSSENKIFTFIKTLPQHERLFFLLMRAYENDVTLDNSDVVAEVYEKEIMSVVNGRDLYYNHRNNDKTKVSDHESISKHESQKGHVLQTSQKEHVPQKEHAFDKAFEEVLGTWDVSSYDDEPDKNEEPQILSKMMNTEAQSNDSIIQKKIDPSDLSEDE